MARRQLSILILLIISTFSLRAQYAFNMSGYITDMSTGEALVGARVSIPSWRVEAFTNHYGYYSISLPPQDVVIYFEYGNYAQRIDSLYIDEDLLYNVQLENLFGNPDDAANVRKSQNDLSSVINGKIDLPLHLSSDLPYLFSEPDLVKALQTLPGIEMGSEGFSNMFVRGGSADQNLILVDDMPVYNTNHMFGLWSTLNPAGMNSVQVMKGGIPARFGGRLSSVIDIAPKEGNIRETDGSVTFSPITANVHVNGPIKDSTTTFALSARRTYLDVLLAPIFSNPDLNLRLNYHDLIFKLSHQLSKYDKLYFSYYNSRDILGTAGSFEDSSGYSEQVLDLRIKWASNSGALRWTHIYSPKLFSSIAFMTSNYRVDNDISLETIYLTGNQPKAKSSFEYMNGIRDLIFKTDFEYKGRNNHWLRFGLNADVHAFRPGYLQVFSRNVQGSGDVDEERGFVNWVQAREIAAYIEDEYRLSGNFKMNVGFRMVSYGIEDYRKIFPEPRLLLNYRINDANAMKLSAGRMHQFVNLLNNRGTNEPTLIWVPADGEIEPQRCDQVSFNWSHQLKKDALLNLDFYYKDMRNLVQPIFNSDFTDVDVDWRTEVDVGDGQAYGAEILLQKNFGAFKGWASYTYSYANRQFSVINNNVMFPFNFDRRHMFKFSGIAKKTYRNSTAFNLTFGSGLPFTLPVAKYRDLNGDEILDFGSVNNYRAPNYFRLDVSWIRDFGYITPDIRHKASFSVYNILFNQNPNTVYANRTVTANGSVFTAFSRSTFVFIPGINYKWEF